MHAKHADKDKMNDLPRRVIGCAFAVLNTLVTGFLEWGFENVLAFELRVAVLSVKQQYGGNITTMTRWSATTSWTCLVENVLLVELKLAKALNDAQLMQCINNLKATGLRLCQLLNLGRPHREIEGYGARPVNRTDPFA